MPRRWIKRYLPDHGTLREHPHLRRFGARLQDGNLWHLNRRSVAGGVAVGLFWAFIPIPFQMLPAAASAIALRTNLPISVVLVWLTNPLTIPPIWYACYQFGAWLLDMPPRVVNFTPSLANLLNNMQGIWKPFLIGSISFSLLSAAVGFALVRLAWRIYIVRHQRTRSARHPRSDNWRRNRQQGGNEHVDGNAEEGRGKHH